MSKRAKVKSDAKATAERILAIRNHGKTELERKLLTRGFERLEVEALLDKLEKIGLLDDAAYAEELARGELDRGHGLNYIRAKLRRRGIFFAPPSLNLEREAESLAHFMKRKGISRTSLTGGPERAKTIRFLRGRGYTTAALASAASGRWSEENFADRAAGAAGGNQGEQP